MNNNTEFSNLIMFGLIALLCLICIVFASPIRIIAAAMFDKFILFVTLVAVLIGK